jgi:cell division protein FtsQ
LSTDPDITGLPPGGADPSADAEPIDVVEPERASFGPSRRTWAKLVIAAAVVQAGIGFGLLRPDHMLVEHVRFEGNARASEVSLRHLVDVRNGTTMWTVDLDRAGTGAAHHPWVRSATARREWPDTVVVTVDEYRPVALLASNGLRYVDADGTAFLAASSDDVDYPILSGIDPDLAEAHPDLPRVVVKTALHLLDDVDASGLFTRDDVSEVHFDASVGFSVQLRSGARVIFGLDGQQHELERLASLVRRGVDLHQRVLVDLAPESIAIVRPLDEPSPAPSPS